MIQILVFRVPGGIVSLGVVFQSKVSRFSEDYRSSTAGPGGEYIHIYESIEFYLVQILKDSNG